MSVSPDYLVDLNARYRQLPSIPSEVIRFGASRADLSAASQLHSPASFSRQTPGELHLLYTGASGAVMPHSLRVLFDGLRLYRKQKPERAARLCFHFLGTSYVAPGEGKPSVLPVAEQCGVADQVREIPHRLGHLECLQLQRNADALLLPGSSDLAYSPSKIYPYYLADRPILALVFKHSVMESVLNELDCAFLARFDETGPKSEAHAVIARFFDLLLDGQIAQQAPKRNDAYFEAHFLASALTQKQSQLFDRSCRYSTTVDDPRAVI